MYRWLTQRDVHGSAGKRRVAWGRQKKLDESINTSGGVLKHGRQVGIGRGGAIGRGRGWGRGGEGGDGLEKSGFQA